MSELVAITHPLTGKLLHLHPDVAAQKHHWLHPDPCIPAPIESLPLFDSVALDKFTASLLCNHSTPLPAPMPNRRANAS